MSPFLWVLLAMLMGLLLLWVLLVGVYIGYRAGTRAHRTNDDTSKFAPGDPVICTECSAIGRVPPPPRLTGITCLVCGNHTAIDN